jgi:hypothetical protein
MMIWVPIKKDKHVGLCPALQFLYLFLAISKIVGTNIETSGRDPLCGHPCIWSKELLPMINHVKKHGDNRGVNIGIASGLVSLALSLCLQSSALAVLPGLPFLKKAPAQESSGGQNNAQGQDRDSAESRPEPRLERESSPPIRDNQHESGRSEPRSSPRENPRDGQRDQFREPSRELPRDNSRDTQRDPQDGVREIPKEAPRELPQPVQPKPPAPPGEPLPRSHDRPWIDARPDLPL